MPSLFLAIVLAVVVPWYVHGVVVFCVQADAIVVVIVLSLFDVVVQSFFAFFSLHDP